MWFFFACCFSAFVFVCFHLSFSIIIFFPVCLSLLLFLSPSCIPPASLHPALSVISVHVSYLTTHVYTSLPWCSLSCTYLLLWIYMYMSSFFYMYMSSFFYMYTSPISFFGSTCTCTLLHVYMYYIMYLSPSRHIGNNFILLLLFVSLRVSEVDAQCIRDRLLEL